MRVAPLQHRAYSYKVTVPPVNSPVSLALFKQHINITHSLMDDILQLYLDAAIDYAEEATGRYLITRTVETYRDFFPVALQNEGYYSNGSVPGFSYDGSGAGFELKRSPLQTVNSIEYIDTDGSSQTVDASVYYSTEEQDFSEVVLADGQCWPTDCVNQMQSITIEFDCGYSDDDSGIKANWKIAIMNHAAALFANRGDCSNSTCKCLLPAASKLFYSQKKILNL